jgi:hypothetical protein
MGIQTVNRVEEVWFILLIHKHVLEHVKGYRVITKILQRLCSVITMTRQLERLTEGYRMDRAVPVPSNDTNVLATAACIVLTSSSLTSHVTFYLQLVPCTQGKLSHMLCPSACFTSETKIRGLIYLELASTLDVKRIVILLHLGSN